MVPTILLPEGGGVPSPSLKEGRVPPLVEQGGGELNIRGLGKFGSFHLSLHGASCMVARYQRLTQNAEQKVDFLEQNGNKVGWGYSGMERRPWFEGVVWERARASSVRSLEAVS